MKWTRTPLANRFRYTCGEWRIDGIQKRFGRATFYVVWRGSERIDSVETLAEAKALVELEIECEAVTQ